VNASIDTHTNILSFAEVEDMFPITYVPRETFTVHLSQRDAAFICKEKMYIAGWEEIRSAYATTVDTNAKELCAQRTYELLHTSGYPPLAEAVHLVEDGNISGMPMLTLEDISRAYEIYGNPPEYVHGKMTKKKVSWAVEDEDLMLDEKKQVLCNVMHIDSNKLLITVCE
jgi:hypothetical protein